MEGCKEVIHKYSWDFQQGKGPIFDEPEAEYDELDIEVAFRKGFKEAQDQAALAEKKEKD